MRLNKEVKTNSFDLLNIFLGRWINLICRTDRVKSNENINRYIWSKHLADTDNLLAELGGLLHEGGSEHGHGHGEDSLHQHGAVSSVAVLSNQSRMLGANRQPIKG